MSKDLTISIVIAAYNEECCLGDCLDSIAAQTVKPDEVIVVNNNSTDKTAKIAQKYSFVTLISETKQGLIAARNTGFEAASGDILARINADVRLSRKWTERAKASFEDSAVGGITGPALAKTLPGLPKFYTKFWSKAYLHLTDTFFEATVMWGANMALRQVCWQKINKNACPDDSAVHEDQDLSLLIHETGEKIVISNNLLVSTDKQDYFYWPKLSEYLRRSQKTKWLHQKLGLYESIQRYPAIVRVFRLTIVILPVFFVAIASLVSYPFYYVIYRLDGRSRY